MIAAACIRLAGRFLNSRRDDKSAFRLSLDALLAAEKKDKIGDYPIALLRMVEDEILFVYEEVEFQVSPPKKHPVSSSKSST